MNSGVSTVNIIREQGVSETIEWIWGKYQEEKQVQEKLQNLCKMLESENRKVWELNNEINGGNGKRPYTKRAISPCAILRVKRL